MHVLLSFLPFDLLSIYSLAHVYPGGKDRGFLFDLLTSTVPFRFTLVHCTVLCSTLQCNYNYNYNHNYNYNSLYGTTYLLPSPSYVHVVEMCSVPVHFRHAEATRHARGETMKVLRQGRTVASCIPGPTPFLGHDLPLGCRWPPSFATPVAQLKAPVQRAVSAQLIG